MSMWRILLTPSEYNSFFIASLVTLFLSLVTLKKLQPSSMRNFIKELRYCQEDLTTIIQKTKCHPILLRLAWSDAASYDCTRHVWPNCGGVNGSIRFKQELDLQHNGGLSKAIVILEKIKVKYDTVSWADLIQMGGALAVELSGGPVVDMVYGRKDCKEGEGYVIKVHHCAAACPPFPDGSCSADTHLRNIFYRLGFTNQQAVTLLGAHTLGRAFSERTGVCSHSSGEQGGTKYTRMSSEPMGAGIRCDGMMAGGISWTKNWLHFDNSYFQRIQDNDSDNVDLLWLPIDSALQASPEFKKYVLIYANDNEKFLQDYAIVHKKMSELGALFQYEGGIKLSDHDKKRKSNK